ncbi:hypothetical protein [Aquimarina sediminis]|uniref:hypothetical protein n=1 Tax=Aquimarina sediminis TaxID=2070536 RepID=UPI000FFE5023|nr:hypothetical protein [Aquimarina sediminis]
MALDFHRHDSNEYLFGLDDSKCTHLEVIFNEYKQWSGVYIDPYGDTKLTVDNQKVLIKIIDAYINKTDLNANKQQTIDILEFSTLLQYFSGKGTEIKILGD